VAPCQGGGPWSPSCAKAGIAKAMAVIAVIKTRMQPPTPVDIGGGVVAVCDAVASEMLHAQDWLRWTLLPFKWLRISHSKVAVPSSASPAAFTNRPNRYRPKPPKMPQIRCRSRQVFVSSFSFHASATALTPPNGSQVSQTAIEGGRGGLSASSRIRCQRRFLAGTNFDARPACHR